MEASGNVDPMRICIVTVAGHGIGGMQDHTRSLARGLVAGGHDVEVITARHPDGLLREVKDGANWHYLDVSSRHSHLPRRGRPWLVGSYEAFASLHARSPFDVIHSESTSAIGLVRKGVHRQVPLVARFHGNAIDLARASLGRARSGGANAKLREAKALIWLFGDWLQYGHWYRFRPCVWSVPSQQEFEGTLRESFLQRSLGYMIPNGIDASVFCPYPRDEVRRELDLAGGPLFACVGRLNREKGVENAIKALAVLQHETDPPARLVVVGEGEERAALEQLVRSLSLEERVQFVGSQPHERVARYIAAADAFLFPTLRAEAAPLVLPQAMATTTPVIASDIGGIPEVVLNTGENGLLVPPGDVPALADAMGQILRDPDLAGRIGEAARRRILAEYTVERMVERTLELYRVAIARAG
jgi:glycosyltransferase involved in cell wall biosynthesis